VLTSRGGVDASTANAIFKCLAPTLFVVPSVRQALDEREERLVQLTAEQARIIQFLDEQAHAAVLGAAGTGKTMLAIEKARRLALPTEPVLFMCYNVALHRYLEAHHAQPNVRYATFHGLARELMGSPSDGHDQWLVARESGDYRRIHIEVLSHKGGWRVCQPIGEGDIGEIRTAEHL